MVADKPIEDFDDATNEKRQALESQKRDRLYHFRRGIGVPILRLF